MGLIWISNVDILISFLICSFFSLFGYLYFVWPMRVHSLNGAQNFKFPGFSDWLFQFLQTPLDWLSCIHFSGYILNIIILRLTKKKKIKHWSQYPQCLSLKFWYFKLLTMLNQTVKAFFLNQKFTPSVCKKGFNASNHSLCQQKPSKFPRLIKIPSRLSSS